MRKARNEVLDVGAEVPRRSTRYGLLPNGEPMTDNDVWTAAQWFDELVREDEPVAPKRRQYAVIAMAVAAGLIDPEHGDYAEALHFLAKAGFSAEEIVDGLSTVPV